MRCSQQGGPSLPPVPALGTGPLAAHRLLLGGRGCGAGVGLHLCRAAMTGSRSQEVHVVQTPTLCCSTEDGPGAARLGSHTLPPAALKPQLLPANLRPGFLSLVRSSPDVLTSAAATVRTPQMRPWGTLPTRGTRWRCCFTHRGAGRLALEAASGETGPASSSSSSRAVLPRPPLCIHSSSPGVWLVGIS